MSEFFSSTDTNTNIAVCIYCTVFYKDEHIFSTSKGFIIFVLSFLLGQKNLLPFVIMYLPVTVHR